MTAGPRRLTAPGVWPGEGAPIQGGAVLVGADGRLAAIGPEAAVPAPPGVVTERLPGALLPGLVNAHTHLELTGLDAHSAHPADFPAWIRQLIAL